MATLDNVVNQLKDNNDVNLGVESALLKLIKLQEDAADNALKAEERRRESKRSSLGASIFGGAVGGAAASGGIGGALGNLGAGIARFGIGSAAGIAALGVGLPAFFGGLQLGEQALGRTTDWLGGNWDFVALGSAVEGFTGLVGKMDETAMIALAGLMGVTGFSRNPVSGALALAAMGAAIPAFLGGLLLGEGVFTVAQDWLGADFDFAATGRVLEGFSSMIGNLTPAAGVALGSLLTAGVVASLKPMKPLSVASTMAVVGASIPALLGGLLTGEAALAGIKWLGVNFNFPALGTAFEGFSGAIDKLTPAAATALAGLLGAAGVATAFGADAGTAASFAAVSTGIGAGISGLMIGLSIGEVGLSWISSLQKEGGGSGLGWIFGIFNESVGKLNEQSLTALGTLIAAGTTAGILVGMGTPAAVLLGAIGIAGIMTGIGAGISGLMIGLGIGEVGLSWISKLQKEGSSGLAWAMGAFNDMILAISPEAVERMSTISTSGAGKGMKDLALGMIGFLTAEGMSEIGTIWGSIKDGVQGVVNFMFGTSLGENEESTIDKMLNSLAPLENFEMSKIEKLERFGEAINSFTRAFQNLAGIELDNATVQLSNVMESVGLTMGMVDHALKGTTWHTPDSNWISRTLGTRQIDFAPGLNNLTGAGGNQLAQLSQGIESLYDALGSSMPDNGSMVAPRDTSLPETLQTLYVENLVMRGNATQPNIIYAPADYSVTSMGSGGGGARQAPPQVFDDRDRFFGGGGR